MRKPCNLVRIVCVRETGYTANSSKDSKTAGNQACITWPPSMLIVWPVMLAACDDAR